MIPQIDMKALQDLANRDPDYAAKVARDYRRAMIVMARKDPSYFCAYVLRNERTSAPILQHPDHEEIHKAILENNRVAIWTHPSFGKCVATGMPILKEDGTWVEVQNMLEWTRVWTWAPGDPAPKLVTARATDNGMKPTLRIHLADGRSLQVTHNHPLMNSGLEWVRADGLRAGSKVVVLRKFDLDDQFYTSEEVIPPDEAEILGYLLAGRALHTGNAQVRTLYANQKWSARRHSLFCAAGWARVPVTGVDGVVITYKNVSGAMSPGVFLKSWATLRNGCPVEVDDRIYRLPIDSIRRLLSAFWAAAFMELSRTRREWMAGTVGIGDLRAPHTVGVLHRETLEMIQRLMLRVGSTSSIAELHDPRISCVTFKQIYGKLAEGRKPWKITLDLGEFKRFWPAFRAENPAGPTVAVPIDAIELVQAPTQTWAVEVLEREHSFIGNGVLNHNTNQISIGHVLWRIGTNPNTTIAIMTNTGALASRIVATLKTYIAESIEFRDVFPNVKPGEKWAETSFSVTRDSIRKDPTVQAVGLSGAIVGARLDGLVIDDIDNIESTHTQEARDATEDKVRRQALTRLEADSWAVAIGNIWHENDCMHRLAGTNWYPLKYPVLKPDGTSRDPSTFSMDRIYQIRDDDVGPLEFQRLYMLAARIDGEQRFKQEWIDAALERGRGLRLMPEGMDRIPSGCRTLTGVDLGVKQKAANDPTAIITILEMPVDAHRVEYQILNLISGRWNAQEIMDRVTEQQRLFSSSVWVESNGCFLPGTRVLTPFGYKPIETIEPETYVWTHMGRWRKVIKRFDGTARHVTPVHAKGALSVSCTPNHAFWVRQAGRTPGRGGGHHRPLDPKGWCSIGFPDVPLYLNIAVPHWNEEIPEMIFGATKQLPRQIVPVGEKLALVLGLFMAEGHSTKGQVFWTLNARETYLADLIEQVLGDLGISSSRRVIKNTLRVAASSIQLAGALKLGTRASKCLPMHWMGWPIHLRLALVRGWFLGDGSIELNGSRHKNPSRSLRGSSVSRDWMLFVRTTLHHAGIPTAMRESRTRKTSVIEGRTVSRLPIFTLSLTESGSNELRTYMTDPAEYARWSANWWSVPAPVRKKVFGSATVLQADGAWARMVPHSLDRNETFVPHEGGPVHNLVVEEDESFTVEDYVVHNAQDFLIQLLNMNGTGIKVNAFWTGKNKYDPNYGVESIAAELATGRWWIPSGDGNMDDLEPQIRRIVEEMLAYTPGNHTGDLLMALWIARESARTSRIAAKSPVQYGRLRLRR